VIVSGTVLDVYTASIGGPWEVTIDAQKSDSIKVVIPSGREPPVARTRRGGAYW
jgi:hypothetical protein